jgi:hypothetical protein
MPPLIIPSALARCDWPFLQRQCQRIGDREIRVIGAFAILFNRFCDYSRRAVGRFRGARLRG